MSSTSTNNNSSSSTFRVNYSEYVADITGSPKTARQSATTGIGHHINPLHNPYPNRQNQPTQQTGGMPQYGGGADKCARCLKTVYIAEKKVGAGRSFHSSCFSCYTCKRKLDSTALSEHKGEIYCKSCYTKQFGAHGLISGVTMSTEQPVTREDRNSRRSSYANDLDKPTIREDYNSRRSSYGNDLDTPVITNQQTRERAYSNDNIFHDEYSIKQNNESPKKYPQRNDILPEQTSPFKKQTDGINAIVDTKYPRSSSPSRVIESNTTNDRHRSTYFEEDDRSKYTHEGEKLSYGSGTSAIVEIPVSYTKRSDSTIGRYETPIEPARDHQRSRSPSVTSNDSYRRQNSREQKIDFTDDYSRLTINDDNNKNNINNRKYSNDNTMNTIASENPLTARNYSHSSSYETKYGSATSNPNNSDREQYHSQEPSPSTTTTSRNRSPSPITGYNSSSSTTRITSSTYRAGTSVDSTSPSATYVPQYDYRNSQTSSNSNFSNRRSTSPPPQSNDRTSSGLNEFISKTNFVGNIASSNGNKNSTLSALVNNARRQNNLDNDDDDDYVD